jgi:hypothetical protein
VPEPITRPGADVIDFEDARRRRARKGNEFKSGLGKGRGMVGEEEGLRRLQEAVEDREKLENTRLTKKEVEGHLKEWAADFDARTISLLNIPDILFISPNRAEFNSTEGRNEGTEISSMIKILNYPLPKSIDNYAMGLVDSSTQSYFFMKDPERKILLMVPLLYLGEGSWKGVRKSLEQATEKLEQMKSEKKEFKYVLCNVNTCRVIE